MQIKKYLFVLALLTLIISCKNNNNLLNKQWAVTKVEFINPQSDLVQTDTLKGDNLQKLTQDLISNILLTVKYNFKENKTCIVSDENHETLFLYELIENGSFIKFTNPKNNSTKNIEIEKLEEEQLILITVNDQSSLKTKLFLSPIKQ